MGTGRAVLVGLTAVDPRAYNGWNGRNGCEGCDDDIHGARGFLTDRGFTDFETCIDDRATLVEVTGSLRSVRQRAKADDVIVLYYAGHGSYVRDANEDDGQSETFILWDGPVVDDQLLQFWSNVPAGCRVVMISDSCHSGTNYRGTGVDVAAEVAQAERTTSDRIPGFNGALIHMAGCRDSGTSAGYRDGGAFSKALLQNVNAAASYRQLFDNAFRQVVRSGEQQRPQISTVLGGVFANVLGDAMSSFLQQSPFSIDLPADWSTLLPAIFGNDPAGPGEDPPVAAGTWPDRLSLQFGSNSIHYRKE